MGPHRTDLAPKTIELGRRISSKRKCWRQVTHSAELLPGSVRESLKKFSGLQSSVATTNEYRPGPLGQDRVGNVQISLTNFHLSAFKKKSHTATQATFMESFSAASLMCDPKLFASLTASQYLRVKHPTESSGREAKKIWS